MGELACGKNSLVLVTQSTDPVGKTGRSDYLILRGAV